MKGRDARTANPAPRDVQDALDRARRHALAALAEAVLATRALVDAAALAATGSPSDAQQWLARVTQALDAAAEQARAGAGAPLAPWFDAVSDALDDEIERWEAKSRQDPEARAVLRAFLGVRELLWEFGLRPRDEAAAQDASDAPRAAASREARSTSESSGRARPPRAARARAVRLERVPVEG